MCVCAVNMPGILTMRTDDDVCVQCVCSSVCARLQCVYLFGHVAQTFVNTHTVNAQVVNEPLNQRPGKKDA